MACLGEIATVTFNYGAETVITQPSADTYQVFEINSPSLNYRSGYQSASIQYGANFKTILTETNYFKLRAIALKSNKDHNAGANYAISVTDECGYFGEPVAIATRPLVAGSLKTSANGVHYYGIFQCSATVKGVLKGFDTIAGEPVYEIDVSVVELALQTITIGGVTLQPINFAANRREEVDFSPKSQNAIAGTSSRIIKYDFSISAQINNARLASLRALSNQIAPVTLVSNYEPSGSYSVFFQLSPKEIGIDLQEVSISAIETSNYGTIVIGSLTLYPSDVVSTRIDAVEFNAKALIAIDQIAFNYRYQVQITALVNDAGLAALKTLSLELVSSFTNNFEASGFTGGSCFIKYVPTHINVNLYSVSITLLEAQALKVVTIDGTSIYNPVVTESPASQNASGIDYSANLQPLLTGPIAIPKRQFTISGICSVASAIALQATKTNLETARATGTGALSVSVAIDAPLVSGSAASFSGWVDKVDAQPTEEYEVFTVDLVVFEI